MRMYVDSKREKEKNLYRKYFSTCMHGVWRFLYAGYRS